MRTEDKFLLYLLKGKCYDRSRQFKQAIVQHQQALNLATANNLLDDESIGHIYFRLGWSYVRSKNNIQSGIDALKKANEMLPDFTELMVKLAGVLFQESGSDSDINQSKALL